MDDETITNYPQGKPDAAHTPAPISQREQDFSGTTLGGYHLVRKIAEGGMGVVYEAIQTKLDRKVALKILTEQLALKPEFLQRFEREAKAAAALNHPNVVQVHDFGEASGWHYLIMEYVEGRDLADYVEKHGKMSIEAALNAIEQAAEALKTAHSKSIIHRDIKPSNLMFTSDGRVKVSDLGLAKILTQDSDVTVSGVGMGSPHFIAPEQADNARRVDHRADIYSLGLTLLFLVTGKKPFEGDSPFSIVLAHVNKPLPTGADLGTELPASVDGLIRRMSAKKPEDRYPDYPSLLADLRRVKAGFAPVLRTPGQPLWKSRKVQIAGVLILVLVIAAAMILSPRRSKKVPAKSNVVVASSQPPQLEPASDERVGGPDPERRGGERFRPGERMRQGDRPGEFQDGGNGNGRRLWPKGRPPESPPVLDDGPPARMMAQADQYAAEHKGEYIRIQQTYRQVEERAFGTPIQEQVVKKLEEFEKEHARVAAAAINEYEQKMLAKLRDGKVEDAYNVWMDFPPGLRNREIDVQIRQIMEKNLPADFDPGP